jgi:membrane fusion protein (multidrug efflux system)
VLGGKIRGDSVTMRGDDTPGHRPAPPNGFCLAMNMRRWLITLSACLLVLAALAGIKYQQIRAAIAFGASFPEPSAAVESLRVAESLAENHVAVIGEIVAPESLELRNELEGRVSALNMAPGSRVRRGDILLQLDISEEQARLEAARASAALAALNRNRLQKLLLNKSVSQDRVDQARAEADIAQANVRQLEAAIDKKTLRAPFDAVVGLHEIEAGEYLAANTAIVMLMGTNDFLWVDFNLPPAQGSVAIGATVEVSVAGKADQALRATVIARNPAVSLQSRNLRYRARIDAAPSLPPGSVVNVRVPAGQDRVIPVPTPAVLRDDLGTYVFVLEPQEGAGAFRARRRAVRLGAEGAQSAAVLEGLAADEMIATHGAFKLRDGMLAHISARPPRDVRPGQAE